MKKTIVSEQHLKDPKAQQYLEYLRNDLHEALEKYRFNPQNKHVLKASERINMFMNIYITD